MFPYRFWKIKKQHQDGYLSSSALSGETDSVGETAEFFLPFMVGYHFSKWATSIYTQNFHFNFVYRLQEFKVLVCAELKFLS